MKKKKILIIFIIIFFFLVIISKNNKKEEIIKVDDEISTEFLNEQIVEINGYSGDAMEPYLSRNEKYLFFNDYKGENEKELYYAEKIDNTTFEFKGEIQGVNTSSVDGNPTMDSKNNFYFISTRDLGFGKSNTTYKGVFEEGVVKGLEQIKGSINVKKIGWINMGVEITKDGNTMYTSNAYFKLGKNYPSEGNIRFAIKQGDEFNIPDNEEEILKNINTDYAVEYAGELTDDGLELYYSQLTMSKPPQFKLYYAKRTNIDGIFGTPQFISEPFKDNKNAFVEGPTLSPDKSRLYYHKLDNGKFSIFMLTRDIKN